jgi:hypothetical protein
MPKKTQETNNNQQKKPVRTVRVIDDSWRRPTNVSEEAKQRQNKGLSPEQIKRLQQMFDTLYIEE